MPSCWVTSDDADWSSFGARLSRTSGREGARQVCQAFEITDLDESELDDLRTYEGELALLLSEDDVTAVAAAIDPCSSAAVPRRTRVPTVFWPRTEMRHEDDGSMRVILLGSPLLGPAVWRPTAVALERLGRVVQVAPATSCVPRQPGEVLEHLLAQVPADEDVALVAHSNAGLFVPAIAARRPVVTSVFADATLPPTGGDAPMAPPEFLGMLQDLADGDGLLPPWTRWWPEDQVASLIIE